MWKGLEIHADLITREASRSVLIAMPHKSKFDGYYFWHPSKCIKPSCNRDAINLIYTDSFTFRLKKFGRGRFNEFVIIDEKQIDAAEFKKAFNMSAEDMVKKEDVPLLHIPEELEPTAIEVLEELKDD